MSKEDSLDEPFVSIIIPFYNSFDSVSRCLDSLIVQTYKNYEAILVDDGSDKSFSTRYKNYLSINAQIRCITHSKNLGVSAARNSGIAESKGELIFFIDADDWVSKDALSNLIKLYNLDSELVVAPHYQYLSLNKIKKKSYLVKNNETLIKKESIQNYVKNYLYLPYQYVMFVHCWNKLYSSKIIKENSISFEVELSQLEDVNFNFKYLKFVNSISYSNTYDYFHNIENKSNSASGLAGSESSSVEKCEIAFSSVKEYLVPVKAMSEAKKIKLLGHHFVSTAIIYLIRMTRAFIKKPSLLKYNFIKTWIESNQLRSKINCYMVQKGESNLIKLAIKIGSTSLFICICFARIQILKLRVYLGDKKSKKSF